MTATERELTQRIADLEGAMQAIGRLLADEATPPKRRLDRIAGVVSMYVIERASPPFPANREGQQGEVPR